MSPIEFYKAGGFFMHPLLVCSIIGLAIIIVKFFTLRTAGLKSKKLLSEVRALMEEGKIQEATQLCEETTGPVAAILLAGLKRAPEGSERVIRAIEHTGALELSFLERGLAALATVSTVAPLLGFLGTVDGMIMAFGAIEAAGEVEPTIVAAGIKVALITTWAGLVIAIPVSTAHTYFVTRIDRLITDMEDTSEQIVDALYRLEKKAPPGVAAGVR